MSNPGHLSWRFRWIARGLVPGVPKGDVGRLASRLPGPAFYLPERAEPHSRLAGADLVGAAATVRPRPAAHR